MCQDFLRKQLSELNALLIKGIHVPKEALEHDFIFEMCQQSAEGCRCQLVADDDAGRSAALEILILVIILLSAGKGHDLRCDIGAELLLAGAVLNCYIVLTLTVLKANELKRNNICSLVKELIEGVLSVGSGLTEDDGTCNVINGLSESVNALTVGLHVKLLKVSRET